MRESTSEIAKQLLESARGDGFETVELLSKPMAAVLEIRRKGEAGQMLSRASGRTQAPIDGMRSAAQFRA